MTSDNKPVVMKPLGDRVLLRRVEQPQKEESTSWPPASFTKAAANVRSCIIPLVPNANVPVEATVVAVGDGLVLQAPVMLKAWESSESCRVPMQVKVGDRVFVLTDGVAVDLEIDGVAYLLVEQHSILLVLRV